MQNTIVRTTMHACMTKTAQPIARGYWLEDCYQRLANLLARWASVINHTLYYAVQQLPRIPNMRAVRGSMWKEKHTHKYIIRRLQNSASPAMLFFFFFKNALNPPIETKDYIISLPAKPIVSLI